MKFVSINGTLVQVPKEPVRFNLTQVEPIATPIQQVVGLTPEEQRIYDSFKHLLFMIAILTILPIAATIGPTPLIPVMPILIASL